MKSAKIHNEKEVHIDDSNLDSARDIILPGDIYDEDSVILTSKRKKKKKKKKKHDSFKTTASKDGTLSSKLKNAFKPP